MKTLFTTLRKRMSRFVKLVVDLDLPSACGHALRH